jgi:hypothetical protein
MNLLSVDIDDTLVQSELYEGEYINAKPIVKEIEGLNILYELGYIIILYTGRHWRHYEITKAQLKEFGIKYHELIMGKIPGDTIDDRSHKTVRDFCKAKGIL